MQNELRPFWGKLFNFNWKFGLFLTLIVCIPRFLVVLQANATQKYHWVGLVMTLYAVAPFVFLNKFGRRAIGITKPNTYRGLVVAFVAGLLISLSLHFLGQMLYESSYENWYVYIAKSYKIAVGISPDQRLIMFVIMALTGMTFSPIGEELFFRGIVHSSFEKSIGEAKASVVDALAFGLTHISHFGLVFIAGHWHFLGLPTLIWVLGMFLLSLIFFVFRKRTGSIWGAVCCHAGFNLGMIYSIFYLMG